MEANDAKKMSDSFDAGSIAKEEFEYAICKIKEAAEQGDVNVHVCFNRKIADQVIGRFRYLGYKVTDYGNPKEGKERHVYIDWSNPNPVEVIGTPGLQGDEQKVFSNLPLGHPGE